MHFCRLLHPAITHSSMKLTAVVTALSVGGGRGALVRRSSPAAAFLCSVRRATSKSSTTPWYGVVCSTPRCAAIRSPRREPPHAPSAVRQLGHCDYRGASCFRRYSNDRPRRDRFRPGDEGSTSAVLRLSVVQRCDRQPEPARHAQARPVTIEVYTSIPRGTSTRLPFGALSAGDVDWRRNPVRRIRCPTRSPSGSIRGAAPARPGGTTARLSSHSVRRVDAGPIAIPRLAARSS